MTCSIGDMEQACECNKPTYSNGRISLRSIDQLPVEDVHSIVWRTGIRKDKFHAICLHHKMVYLNKFTFLHPFCTNPFRHHGDNKYIKGEFMLITILKYKLSNT